VLNWIERWDAVISLVEVALSVVGFSFALIGIHRSRTAATAAARAAAEARDAITRYDSIADLASATSIMEEIKRLHRAGAWPTLLDQYSSLRRRLVSIRTSGPNLTARDLAALNGAVQQFLTLEKTVEKSLQPGSRPLNVPQLNAIVSTQIEKLDEIFSTLRGGPGGSSS
jgi:hypothetical protein